MTKIKKSTFISISSVFIIIAVNLFLIQNLNTNKKATIFTLFLIIFTISTWKLFKSTNISFHESSKNYTIITFIILLPIVLITQNFDLNFEQITWDTASYLVASQEIGLGFIPFETSWESKGPLLFYIYYFLNLLTFKSYVFFRIVNDLIILLISLMIFKISFLKTKKFILSFSPALLYTILVSKEWYVSEFSEIYCILILSIAIYYKEKNNFNSVKLIGLLLSLNSLINQGSILFIIPFLIWIFSNDFSQKKYRNTINFFIFLALPQIFVITIYGLKNMLDLYFANYVTIPISYSGDSLSSIYELRVWMREFYNFNFIIYAALSLMLLSFFFGNILNLKYISKNFFVHGLVVSLIYYFAGSHNFYHHLFYFLFFVCFFLVIEGGGLYKYIASLLIVLGSCVTFVNFYEKSFNNLSNYETIQSNYPLYQLSQEIDSYFTNDQYTILAVDYVLVLHYLQKQNYAYIVHPTNHFEDYIENTLIRLGYIEKNNISVLIDQEPDVILCNDTLIIRGVVQNIVDFNCNINEYKNNYLKLDTEIYNNNPNRDRYFDPTKNMNVFIKISE